MKPENRFRLEDLGYNKQIMERLQQMEQELSAMLQKKTALIVYTLPESQK